MTLPPSIRDLAPGDAKSAALDLSRFTFERIRSTDDPHFAEGFARLWEVFGPRDEMEQRDVLARRFQRAPEVLYEMVLVKEGERFAAVRDHTAIPAGDGVVVHLSHNFVAPDFRRTGLAGWMRALPLLAARECAAAHGIANSWITLVGEMEFETPGEPERTIRLRAYEKAGFRKIDPASVRYHQPDFRAAEAIDKSGGARPLPFQLVIRQVGRENETAISGWRVRQLVTALYALYGPHSRPQDMAHPALRLDGYPNDDAMVALVSPTAPV